MLQESLFHWKLRRLQRRHQVWAKENSQEQKKALSRGATREEMQKLEWNYQTAQEVHDEEIAKLQTSYLLDEIDRLLIPRPEFVHKEDSPETSTWIESRMGGFILTPHTMIELRDAVRKERKERSEIFRLWLGIIAPIVTAVAGLGGVLIGLLAALHTSGVGK